MITLDYTVLFQAIFFLGLWFVLNKLLFAPFLRLMEERERRTEGVRKETAALESEITRLRAEYDQGLAQARDAGYGAKEALLQEARQQRERLLAEAREEAAKTLERVRQEIRQELSKEREIAAREAAVVAQEMAAKILGRRIA